MTLLKTNINTELRSLPFGRLAGYSSYRSLIDQAGRHNNIAGFGDLQVGTRTSDISESFHYGALQDDLNVITANGATVTTPNSILNLSSRNAGDSAQVSTKAAIIYSSGFDSVAMFTAAFTKNDSAAVIHQEIGPHDNNDGYAISVSGTELEFRRYRGGSIVEQIKQSNFNIDKADGKSASEFTLNVEAMNIYRIQYGYLGILPATLEVFGGNITGWIPLHVINHVNTDVSINVANPHLPIVADCEVISGDPGKTINFYSGSWYGGSIGGQKSNSDTQTFGARSTVTILPGIETPVLAIRNKTTFQGLENRIRSDLSWMSADSDGTKSVEFLVYANPNLIGGIWLDVDTNFSIMEYNFTAVSFTGGRYMGSLNLGKVANDYVQMPYGEVRQNPSDMLLVTALSANSSDIRCSLRWGETR